MSVCVCGVGVGWGGGWGGLQRLGKAHLGKGHPAGRLLAGTMGALSNGQQELSQNPAPGIFSPSAWAN